MKSFRLLALCTLLAAASAPAAFAQGTAVVEAGSAIAARAADAVLSSPAAKRALQEVLGPQAAGIFRGSLATQRQALTAALASEQNAALRAKLTQAFANVPADASSAALEAAANAFAVAARSSDSASLQAAAAQAQQAGGGPVVSREAIRPRRAQSVPDTGTVLRAEDVPHLAEATAALRARGDVPAEQVTALEEAVLDASKRTGLKAWVGSGFGKCVSAFTSSRAVGNVVEFVKAVKGAGSVGAAVQQIDEAIGAKMDESPAAARARRCSITEGSSTGQRCPIIGQAAALGC